MVYGIWPDIIEGSEDWDINGVMAYWHNEPVYAITGVTKSWWIGRHGDILEDPRIPENIALDIRADYDTLNPHPPEDDDISYNISIYDNEDDYIYNINDRIRFLEDRYRTDRGSI